MKVLNLQLSRLTIVSNCLQACEREDEPGQAEAKIALEALNKVISFLSNMNTAFAEIGPDICPNCEHDLAE